MEEIKKTEQTLETDLTKKKVKKKKKRGSAHKTATWILIVGIIIILIPCGFLAYIIIQASDNTAKPVEGNRFAAQLEPAILDSDISSIESSISNISGVENVSINLTTGQLRITIDTKDSYESSEIEELVYDAYDVVSNKLPISTYFTNSSSKRMYDLLITAYNVADIENPNMDTWQCVKNGQMADPLFEESKVIPEVVEEEIIDEEAETAEE